jgi:hypothetical protein
MYAHDPEVANDGQHSIVENAVDPANAHGPGKKCERPILTRAYPRIAMSHPVEVSGPDGERVDATLIDLSPDGLRLALDHHAVRRICPLGHLTSPADAVHLSVRVANPDSITPGPGFEATGTVIHVRRLSQFQYQAGLKFDGLTERARTRLVRWLGATDL